MTTTPTALRDIIGRTPMMRAMQIADRLDVAVDEVDVLLRQSIQASHIIEHEVDAPNNRKAMAYELSAQYAAASARQPALTTIVCTQNPAPVANERTTSREPTKVDRAIAYVRENGPSSSAQLHAELGLPAGVHVSSYLGAAVRGGRMLRDGNVWSLPGAGTVAPADIPKFSTIRSPLPASDHSAQQHDAAVDPASKDPDSPIAFRCALWSDGTFEIQRNGTTVASLRPSEHRAVIETLQRAAAA